MPGSVPKPITGYDTTAPLVLTAAAGETVTSTQHGTSFSYTAPTPFPSTHVAVDGGVTIHVVPKAAPTGAAAASNVHRGVEDRAINIQLWGKSSWAPGSALVPKITALPTGESPNPSPSPNPNPKPNPNPNLTLTRRCPLRRARCLCHERRASRQARQQQQQQQQRR